MAPVGKFVFIHTPSVHSVQPSANFQPLSFPPSFPGLAWLGWGVGRALQQPGAWRTCQQERCGICLECRMLRVTPPEMPTLMPAYVNRESAEDTHLDLSAFPQSQRCGTS